MLDYLSLLTSSQSEPVPGASQRGLWKFCCCFQVLFKVCCLDQKRASRPKVTKLLGLLPRFRPCPPSEARPRTLGGARPGCSQPGHRAVGRRRLRQKRARPGTTQPSLSFCPAESRMGHGSRQGQSFLSLFFTEPFPHALGKVSVIGDPVIKPRRVNKM